MKTILILWFAVAVHMAQPVTVLAAPSPGCPTDMIWDGSSCRYPVSFNKPTSCAEGEHKDTILTYIVQANKAAVSRLDSFRNLDGQFIELQIAKDALAETVPYFTNDVENGHLFQDVLNSSQFLQDWVDLSSADPSLGTLFFNPMGAAARQCFKGYQSSVESYSTTPPNAMIRFLNDEGRALVVDIFDISSSDDGSMFTFIARLAPPDSELHVPEGRCHTRQDLNAPHYHHNSKCADIILEYEESNAGVLENVQGKGVTIFLKFTVWVPPPNMG